MLAQVPLIGLSTIVFFGAVTVVVVLTSGDPADGSTAALERALRSALPDRTEVVVQRDDPPPSPTDWVARLEWTDHERRAIVRATDGEHATEREIHFAEADLPSERGRAVGFALASMVPDALFASKTPAPPAAVPAVVPTPPPRPRETPVLTPARREPRFALELLGQGATGIGGTAGGLGGVAAARLSLPRGVQLRAAVALRLGEVPTAQATSRVIAPSFGVGWLTPVSDAFAVGARVDALLLHQYVSHFSPDDPEPDGRGRFLPGVDARIEGAFRIAESTRVILAFGPEVAFGTTRLYVVGVETDRIPPLRLCGEVGITVAF